jgi:threonine dehydratase
MIAERLAQERGLDMVASFHPELVMGVATYPHELFSAVDDLDAVYVPIGLGSGICATIAVRDLLGLRTKVIGVVAERASAYALSFAEGRPVVTNSAATFADGIAVRTPNADALAAIRRGAERIVTVGEEAIAGAIRLLHRATHNTCEGAGAAALAALMKERDAMRGKRVAIILSGGNIDAPHFATVLSGHTPSV